MTLDDDRLLETSGDRVEDFVRDRALGMAAIDAATSSEIVRGSRRRLRNTEHTKIR